MLAINHYQPKLFSSLIERITIAKTSDNEFNLMFIPTHYVTLFVPLNNSIFYYDGIKHSKPVLKNMLLKTATIRIPENSVLFGIRFYPFGAFPFSELTNLNTNYNTFEDDNAIIEQVLSFLQNNYQTEKEQQITLLKDFYYYLIYNVENSSVKDFCTQQSINYMAVYRSFHKILNISPKKFERLIKFRLSVDYMISKKQKLSSVSIDSGYYDQAHFIKEFKYFVGMTPSEYIKYLSNNNLYDYNNFANFTSIRM